MLGQCRVPSGAPGHKGERERKEGTGKRRVEREALRRAAVGTCTTRVPSPVPASGEERDGDAASSQAIKTAIGPQCVKSYHLCLICR